MPIPNSTPAAETGPQKRAIVDDVRVMKGANGGFDIQVRARVKQTGKPARKSRKDVNAADIKQAVVDLLNELEA